MTDNLIETELGLPAMEEVELDPETARLRVKLGAALLDEKRPDWFTRIDLRWLRLVDSGCCVLGQAYPESEPIPVWASDAYESAAEFLETWPDADPNRPVCTANYDLGRYLLGLDNRQCEEHGFLIDPDRNPDGTYPVPFGAYQVLEAAWTELIAERQREATHTPTTKGGHDGS